MQTQEYTFDENIVSDLFKDAYGYRPREGFWQRWEEASDAEKQAEWDWLVAAVGRRIEEEAEEQRAAVVTFEKLVAETIRCGADSRESALRWIMDASTCNGDWEFLCYEHGLPYRYFSKEEWMK